MEKSQSQFWERRLPRANDSAKNRSSEATMMENKIKSNQENYESLPSFINSCTHHFSLLSRRKKSFAGLLETAGSEAAVCRTETILPGRPCATKSWERRAGQAASNCNNH